MSYRYNIRSGVTKIKSKTNMALSGVSLGAVGLAFAIAIPLSAKAAGNTVVVTPANTQGWSTADTRPGGTVSYVTDNSADAPYPSGALQLTTDSTTAAKAQYMHAGSGSINDVTELSYYTKQVSGPPTADPSYQLGINTAGGFTTLVFEPYWNTAQGPVVNGVWQKWNVASGLFWSSKTVTCSNGVLVAGAGGPPLYTLQQVQTMCPEATVVDFGVNIGTYNPDYVVRTDGVDFNGTTYNFELTNTPNDKDQCKNGGYVNYTDQTGAAFKNQGQCVSWTNGRGQ